MALRGRKKGPAPEEIEVVGGEARPLLRDAYLVFIRASWATNLAVVTLVYIALNLAFAGAYALTGGIGGAHSFLDLFFFSVQTSGTIGYGVMFPESPGANFVMAVESLASILLVALTTGLVFAKFSIARARVQFAEHPVICPFDGLPTLMFRLGNQRDSRLIEAVLRVVMIRTEKTREGVVLYRMYDLPLERDRSPALSRSWTVMHRLVAPSPLAGATAASLERDEVDFIITLTGIDDVSAQSLHAQKQYTFRDVLFGVRHADMLSERADGGLRIDLVKFNELVPAPSVEEPVRTES